MKLGVQFDQSGDFVGDFLEGMELAEGHQLVEGNIQDGLYRPKLVNGIVIEGLTQAEIDAIKNAPQPPSEMDMLGQQLVERELEALDLKDQNDILGQQLVDMDLRLLQGGF